MVWRSDMRKDDEEVYTMKDSNVYTLTNTDMGIDEADLAISVADEDSPIMDLKFTTAESYMEHEWGIRPDDPMDTDYPDSLDIDLGYMGNDDSLPDVTPELNIDAQIQLINSGLDYLIENMKRDITLTPNNLGRSAHYVSLTDEQALWLFQFGCINAYKKGNGL